MFDGELDKLSVKELQDLKSQVEDAIRAAIRQRANIKAGPVHAVAKAPAPVDLERERDAWMAAKRQGKTLSAQ